MGTKLIKILNHRDFVLSLAVVAGLIFGDKTSFLAKYSLYFLMLAMAASTIKFSFKSWSNPLKLITPIFGSLILNYIVYGTVSLLLAFFLFHNTGNELLWIGFVIIAASPPGPAVIPFSAMLKGDSNFSTTGLFGLYFLAMIITPTILFIFIGSSLISPLVIFNIMIMLIIVPLIISRFLRHKKVMPHSQKYSGTIIKWLFFLIITPIVGMNRHVFFDDYHTLLKVSLVLFISMFVLSILYNILMLKIYPKKGIIISSTFIMSIKSSAFAAVVAFNFFKDEPIIAMPAAVLSVFIILFTIFYSFAVKYIFKNYDS